MANPFDKPATTAALRLPAGADAPVSDRPRAADWALGLLSSALFFAAFPGGPAPWAGWFALVPAGVMLHRARGRGAFWLPFCCAVAGWLLSTWWIVPGVINQAGTQPALTLLFHLLFCLFSALPYGLAAWISSRFAWTDSLSGAFKSAAAWTALVGAYPTILPGNLAHSQYPYPVAFQLLELGGVPLLLFVMHWINWLLIAAVVRRRRSPRTALAAAAIAAGALAATIAYGHLRLDQIARGDDARASSAGLTVGIVQPNIPVARRDAAATAEAQRTLEAMTRRLAAEGAELTIWPEVPIHVSHTSSENDRRWLQELVQSTGVPLLVSGYVFAPYAADKPPIYFNSVEWVRAGETATVYRKRRLLPFAEYLPGESLFPPLRRLFPGVADYRPGEGAVVFRLANGIGLIPAICYEAVFPGLVADGLRQGGNVLVNPVDDAWFGNTAGPTVHLALAVYRSVEFRLPVLRVANSGISGVIRPSGEFAPASRLPLAVAGAAVHRIAAGEADSLYARIGDLALAVACALTAWFVATAWRRGEGRRISS